MKNSKLLMIPGPIEFEPAVMRAMGMPTTSHIAPEFIEIFGQALERTRKMFLSPQGQPFILPGSGTLGMDSVAANLVEPGDKALVINTGFFSRRYSDILERYGAHATNLDAPAVGDAPSLEAVEKELKSGRYEVMTVTHVDTSTGVCFDVKGLAGLAQECEVLLIVDGVCSLAAEELRMDEWGVDVALTASQKAVGTPPGLALIVAGPKAMKVFRQRKTPVRSYYADWNNWLPVMEAYEARTPAYFGTPAVNLVWALNESLKIILAEGLYARWERHRRMSTALRAGIKAMGLSVVPVRAELQAVTITPPYYPKGVGPSLLGLVKEAGVIVAGGKVPEIKSQYFRIGHMGSVSEIDVLATVGAIEIGLARAGYRYDVGAGVRAATQALAA
jgi:alanine-glyoxylate transaminase/serine-glyoxylate transaminase/serine-pyruvate transaminase